MKSLIRVTGLLISMIYIGACSGNFNSNKINTANVWKVIGPGGGGGVLKPTISPFNENFVMTHCDMTAAYVTHDGGENWSMKNLYNVPDDFEFDPVDSNIVYIATRGFLHSDDRGSGISLVLRSDNQGEKWKIIFPDVSKSKRVERLQSTSLKPSDLIDGALDGTVQKVKVDPGDNDRIYLGLAPLIDYMGGSGSNENISPARLVLSTDHGLSWKVLTELPGKKVLAIFPDRIKKKVTVFTESSCLLIDEITGKDKILPLPVNSMIAVEGSISGKRNLIYIQSRMSYKNGRIDGGMFVSDNSGITWKQINDGLLNDVAKGKTIRFRQGLAICTSQPEVAYISTINPIINASGEGEDIYSIYKTTDAGRLWKPMLLSSTPSGYITHNFEGSWMEESFDPGWGGSPIDLAVAPGNPDVCFAGDNGRGYKTNDGGLTWEQVYSYNNTDGSYSNTGLNVTTCYGVHFDPFDRDHFFISYTDMGLFHSFNGGKSWYHSITDIPRKWTNTCYDVEFDPAVKGKVWSVWANAHDLPRTKMFGGRGFDHFSGGVALSEDSGRSWEKSNSGMPENSVCTNILLDPFSPVDSRILYVSLMGKGVYKTSDGGKSWKESNKGLDNDLFTWQLRRSSNGRIFALFARGLANGKTVDGSVYYSDNGAESWQKIDLPDGVNGPHDLLIDYLHPDVMYISCWPYSKDGNDINGGVIKTIDGGLTWKQIFDNRVRVNAAGIDPVDPKVLYINTFQNAAYRSEDSGSTWSRIEGYRFKWGQRAVPDINNPGMLFLTTYGGSVFYGPAKGILDAALKGQGFHCGHYMKVQNGIMNAFGYVTRTLGAGPGVKGGPDGHHGINEVWLNQYNKWFLSDAKYDHHFEKDGIPLSALEVRDEYLKNEAADIIKVKGPGRVTFDKDPETGTGKVRSAQTYTWIEWHGHNDMFTVWPDHQELLIMYDDDFFKNNTWIWGGNPHWAYAKPEFMKLVPDRDAIYWTPNTIDSKVSIEGRNVHIELTSETPNLKEYQMKEMPSGEWVSVGDKIDLKLKNKEYEWLFRTVNLADVTGPKHKIVIKSK